MSQMGTFLQLTMSRVGTDCSTSGLIQARGRAAHDRALEGIGQAATNRVRDRRLAALGLAFALGSLVAARDLSWASGDTRPGIFSLTAEIETPTDRRLKALLAKGDALSRAAVRSIWSGCSTCAARPIEHLDTSILVARARPVQWEGRKKVRSLKLRRHRSRVLLAARRLHWMRLRRQARPTPLPPSRLPLVEASSSDYWTR
jgi:hypothetical protein